jgi:hypothetical protein
MTWIEDIGAYLQTQGFGTIGTNIHYYIFDKMVSNDITLIPFSVSEYNRIISDGVNNPRPKGLEVLVRNQDAETAFNTVTSIYELLRIVANQTIGSTHFINVEADASPGFVGKSEGELFNFSVNFSLLIQ